MTALNASVYARSMRLLPHCHFPPTLSRIPSLLIAIVLASLLSLGEPFDFAGSGCADTSSAFTSTANASADSSHDRTTLWRTCLRVIDGDTIELNGHELVRLIGVDTPESKRPGTPVEYFAIEATRFTTLLVSDHRLRLEYDQTRKDRYGRTLAYIFREDSTFVNAEIICQGFGFAYPRYPFRYLEDFLAFQREARDAGRGLWAPRE